MIFIDSGAFIAKFLEQDQYHSKAVLKWSKVEKSHQQCFTTNFVLDEVFTFLGRRCNYEFAASKADLIYSCGYFEILRPQLDDELKALTLFKKYADQKVSFTDCISFVMMKHKRIKHAFSFDKHFKSAGFQII